MPRESFRGDPYRVLDLTPDAAPATIKRRWRELAQAHHPDRAGGDEARTAELTRRMARINAAYELLRDPDRRARYDDTHGSPAAAWRRGHEAFDPTTARARSAGPPPPPPTRPVTARFDASEAFRPRNTTTSRGRLPLAGHRPRSAREFAEGPEPLRASDPTGPIRRHQGPVRERPPSLATARAKELEFGKFRGHTLGEVADFEPTYIDWIARTITRDRELVMAARVVQADLDDRGVARRVRPPTPGFGTPRADTGAA
jgi:curved DNA-binding protein CbpA